MGSRRGQVTVEYLLACGWLVLLLLLFEEGFYGDRPIVQALVDVMAERLASAESLLRLPIP